MILKQIVSSLVRLFVVLICWVRPRRPPLLLSGMKLGGTGGVAGVHPAGVVGGVGVGRCWGSGGGRLRQLVSRGPVGRAGGHVRPLRLLLETGMSPLQPKEKNWLCFNKCHLKVLKRRIYLRVYHHYYRLMKKRGNSAKGQFNGHYYLVFFWANGYYKTLWDWTTFKRLFYFIFIFFDSHENAPANVFCTYF